MCIIALTVFVGVRIKVQSHQQVSYETLHANLNKYILNVGIANTFKRVLQVFDGGSIDVNKCHSLMHQIGHAAYEFHPGNWDLLTLDATQVCMNGYVHGVEAQMAMQWQINPEDSASILRNYCSRLQKKKPGMTCYHGAGHAFVQSYNANIAQALGLCDELTGQSDPTDCYSGVFSEYRNYLSGYDGDNEAPIAGREPIAIRPEHVFDECFSLADQYQVECVRQFSSFLYTGELAPSISACAHFEGWPAKTCTHIITVSYASVHLPIMHLIPLPEGLMNFSEEVRKGYIDGIFEAYSMYKNFPFYKDRLSWCDSFPIAHDKEYCKNFFSI